MINKLTQNNVLVFVFKRLVLQTRKNQGLFGKGLSGQFNADFNIKSSAIINTLLKSLFPEGKLSPVKDEEVLLLIRVIAKNSSTSDLNERLI